MPVCLLETPGTALFPCARSSPGLREPAAYGISRHWQVVRSVITFAVFWPGLFPVVFKGKDDMIHGVEYGLNFRGGWLEDTTEFYNVLKVGICIAVPSTLAYGVYNL